MQPGAFDLGGLNLRLDKQRDALGDSVLEVEYIAERAVEILPPEIRADDAVNELCADSDPIASATHTDAKIAGNVGPPRKPLLNATARSASLTSAIAIRTVGP